MKRRWRWIGGIAVGLISYIVGLVVTVPADIAWSYVRGDTAVELHQPMGTVQSGSAGALSSGLVAILEPRWSWQPGALANGSLAWSVQGELADGNIATTVWYRFGTLGVDDLRAEMSVSDLARMLGRAKTAQAISGRIMTDIESLRLRERRLRHASGTIRWLDASVGAESGFDLGDIRLELEDQPDSEGIRGQLQARGGDIALDGQLTLARNGAFELSVKPRGETDSNSAARRLSMLLGAGSDSGPLVINGHLDATGITLGDK